MPDIAMCKDNHCPLRDQCYRARAIPSSHRQAYFAESPRAGDKCAEHLPLLRGDRLQPTEGG